MFIKRLLANDDGATAIEYGLLVALVAIVGIAAMSYVGEETGATFNMVGNAVSSGRAKAPN